MRRDFVVTRVVMRGRDRYKFIHHDDA